MSKLEITSNRLYIREIEQNDISDEYISWLNNKDLLKYSLQSQKKHDYISSKNFLKKTKKDGDIIFAIFYNKLSKVHIGNIGVSFYEYNNSADLSILIGNQSYHNKGIALEAWNIIMDFIFTKFKVRKVTAGAVLQNIAMVKLAKSSGMIEDGLRSKHYVINNIEYDIIHFAKFNK